MTVVEDQPRTGAPLLLPEHPPRLGPMSRRLLARLGLALLALHALAVALFVVGTDTARAAATSLVFPGAGFLYTASPVLFLVTAGALLVALVAWWGASAHLAIPLVWLASVAGAAALGDGPRLFLDRGTTWPWAIAAAYLLAAGSLAWAVWRFERRYRAKRARIPALNAYLAEARAPERRREARPPDAMDVELLRWAYAIADQPADGLTGLDWGEQFHSGTQLRYQLNALCWALSLYAANVVPNAQTQVEGALARLITKHTDLRVWRYWRTLNLLGNFDPNPDPIVRDNIMFSAFLGDVINVYEAATGSDRFDQPGSLTFVWSDGRTFPYDHHSIAAAVEHNYERSKLGFFPCEPGWSFTVCNVMGAQSLRGHDTLHGTEAWARVRPRWVRTLDEEYSTPDGAYAHIRSNHVGLSWDTGEVPGGHYFAAGSNRFADILPDHARRAAALERHHAGPKLAALASRVVDGRLDLELPATLERHRARRSALGAWNGVIGGARLVGEHALATAALDAAARQCATGARWPDRPLDGSVPAIGGHMMVRWSTPLSTADLNVRGYVPPAGPRLDDTDWDAVLVTEARSPDGRRLDLRLEPMGAEPVRGVRLGFTHLEPGRRYRLDGLVGTDPWFHADADGAGGVTIDLPGPVVSVLTPEDAA
jgi:hypothetical protein